MTRRACVFFRDKGKKVCYSIFALYWSFLFVLEAALAFKTKDKNLQIRVLLISCKERGNVDYRNEWMHNVW